MDDITVTRTGFAALIGIIAYLSGKFSNLFWILCLLMLIDYITGLIASIVNHKASSKIGLFGIFKKLMYIMIIVFGFLIDLVIINAASQLNLGFVEQEMKYISVGTILIIFYVGNESLSIIENCDKLNLKIPGFLRKIVYLIKNAPSIVLDPVFKKNEKYLKDIGEDNKTNSEKIEDINESNETHNGKTNNQ